MVINKAWFVGSQWAAWDSPGHAIHGPDKSAHWRIPYASPGPSGQGAGGHLGTHQETGPCLPLSRIRFIGVRCSTSEQLWVHNGVKGNTKHTKSIWVSRTRSAAHESGHAEKSFKPPTNKKTKPLSHDPLGNFDILKNRAENPTFE